MASHANTTDKAFGQFLTALTAVDQLTPTEKRRAASDLRRFQRDTRYVAWMTATACVLATEGVAHLVCCASVKGLGERPALTKEYAHQTWQMMTAVEAFLDVPVLGRDDLKDRRQVLKRAKHALALGGGFQRHESWFAEQEQKLAA